MSTNAIKLDSQFFSVFQKELHRRRGSIDADGFISTVEPVTTILQHRLKKISWYTPVKHKLSASDDVETTIYTVDGSFDHLFKTFMNVLLPSLSVRPKYHGKYRISWTHNIGININESAELRAGDITINSFDSVGHDILSQYGYLVKPGFKKHHLISIGSVPKLEAWTTHLQAHQLNVLQPFYYAKGSHLALPILNSSLTKFRHIYRQRRRILDLLRMQKFDDKEGVWIDVKPDHRVISELKSRDDLLKTPELWGRYGKITDEERDWYKECNINHEYYYDDLVVCDDTNTKRYGETATIPIKALTPVKAIFWVSQNLRAKSLNSYSNYTTNDDVINMGWNPSSKFRVSYGASMRVAELSIDHAEREEAWEFPRAPWEPGYNAITFCNNPFSIDGESSVDLQENNASLIVTLGNTDPNLISIKNYGVESDLEDLSSLDDDKEEGRVDTKSKGVETKETEFIVRSRLLVYRKLSYIYESGKGYVFKSEDLDPNQVWFDDEIKKMDGMKRQVGRRKIGV